MQFSSVGTNPALSGRKNDMDNASSNEATHVCPDEQTEKAGQAQATQTATEQTFTNSAFKSLDDNGGNVASDTEASQLAGGNADSVSGADTVDTNVQSQDVLPTGADAGVSVQSGAQTDSSARMSSHEVIRSIDDVTQSVRATGLSQQSGQLFNTAQNNVNNFFVQSGFAGNNASMAGQMKSIMSDIGQRAFGSGADKAMATNAAADGQQTQTSSMNESASTSATTAINTDIVQTVQNAVNDVSALLSSLQQSASQKSAEGATNTTATAEQSSAVTDSASHAAMVTASDTQTASQDMGADASTPKTQASDRTQPVETGQAQSALSATQIQQIVQQVVQVVEKLVGLIESISTQTSTTAQSGQSAVTDVKQSNATDQDTATTDSGAAADGTGTSETMVGNTATASTGKEAEASGTGRGTDIFAAAQAEGGMQAGSDFDSAAFDAEMSSLKEAMSGMAAESAPDAGDSAAPKQSIAEIASGSDDFNILTRALDTAGLTDAVATGEDLTVFAPTDEAFGQLAKDLGYEGDVKHEDEVFSFLVGALTELGNGDPIPPLTDILQYHVAPGARSGDDIAGGGSVGTLLEGEGGASATIAPRRDADGSIRLGDKDPDIEDPRIVVPDLQASNGKIQGIDRVLLPLGL